jgi:NTP pyrophosphatase (non-canonical NTP hydrolase)
VRIHLNADKYQELAMRTRNSPTRTTALITGALGLTGEAGEVADHIKKWYDQGHELQIDKVINELGDVCWYVALMATALDVPLSQVLEQNIEKLRKRFPNGFEVERSVNREDN